MISALQAYDWHKEANSDHGAKQGKTPFVRYNCSLRDQVGHNIMQCELRPYLLNVLPELKAKLMANKATSIKPEPLNH